MKTIEALEAFSSYPNGKDERAFAEGEEAELSNEHADLLIGKGLAREKGAGGKGGSKKPPPPVEDEPPVVEPPEGGPAADATEEQENDK